MSLFLLPNVSIWNVCETSLIAFDLAFDTYHDFLCFHSHNFTAIKENSMEKMIALNLLHFSLSFLFPSNYFSPSFIILLSNDVHRETLQKQFLNNGLIDFFFIGTNRLIAMNEKWDLCVQIVVIYLLCMSESNVRQVRCARIGN